MDGSCCVVNGGRAKESWQIGQRHPPCYIYDLGKRTGGRERGPGVVREIGKGIKHSREPVGETETRKKGKIKIKNQTARDTQLTARMARRKQNVMSHHVSRNFVFGLVLFGERVLC